jgi:hypothetical protein
MTSALFLAISLIVSGATPSVEPTTKLIVRPMAAPRPALRYLLLPEVREQNPGNSVQWYIRCFAEQRNFFFTKESNDLRKRYREMPLAELAKEDLKTYGGSALTQADWGARLESLDWDVLRKVQSEGSELRLPELAAFRVLSVSLQVRFRAAVARDDWDTAITTAKTMFAFARHLGEHPTLAGNLLGLETAELALHTLEEMIQQPNAPNLYWAYTDLPRTLVELRKGLQGDRVLVDSDLALVRTDSAMTDEELEQFVSKLSGRIGSVRERAGLPPRNVRAAISKLVEDRERAARVRNRLLKDAQTSGVIEKISALKVLDYSPLQLILIEERRDFEIRRDESLKLLSLDPWEIDALVHNQASGGAGLFADFLPNVIEHRRAQARIEQRIGLLRCLEAIRLYAAEHEGRPPENLNDITMPLPVDPFTGKAFVYTMNGQAIALKIPGKSIEVRLVGRDAGAGKP